MAQTFTKQSITHETAQKMVAAAVAKAQELGVPQVVAILDESGLLKTFCRMDGAALVSIEVAQNKAYTALFGMPSQDFYNFIKDDPALLAGVPHLPRIAIFGGGRQMKPTRYPTGWNEERVRKLLQHYETQTEEEAVAEDEAAFRQRGQTVMVVPKQLVSTITRLIATEGKRRQSRARRPNKRAAVRSVRLKLQPDKSCGG